MSKIWKRVCMGLSVSAMMMVATMSAFATGGGTTVDSVMADFTTGITGQVGGIMSAIGTVAVAGLGVFALVIAIKLGLKVFRSVTGR